MEYETDSLLGLGYAFRKFIRDSAINYAGMEVAKATVLHAFFGNFFLNMLIYLWVLTYIIMIAAVALPVTILKIADVIDNPWQMVVDRSRKAGVGKVVNLY